MPVRLQVAAFHGAHIVGFNDKVPPVIYKRVRYEWMDRACGGVNVSSESKERFPNYKFKQRRLLGMDTVRRGRVCVVITPRTNVHWCEQEQDAAQVSPPPPAPTQRRLLGLMTRAVNVEGPDMLVLGAHQTLWKDIRSSKDVNRIYKPGRSPWIKVHRSQVCSLHRD